MTTTALIETAGTSPQVNRTEAPERDVGSHAASEEAAALFQRSLGEQTAENAALGEALRAAMTSVSGTLEKVAGGLPVRERSEDGDETETDVAAFDESPEVTAEALVAAGVVASAAAPAEQVAASQPATVVAPVDVVRMQPAEAVSSAVLLQAAEAVADALLVTPGLLRGQGEVLVQLRPDVLEGTEVKISVTGRQLEVVFQPQTVDMAVMIESCRSQLVQHLAAKIVSFNVSVDVRKKRA